MSYDIESFDKPEDKRRGMIGTATFHAILLFLIIFPWFSTVYPIPEAEGLMASFGDVDIAGGAESEQEQPAEEPVEEEPVEEVEEVEEIEEVETVEDTEAPVVNETKPKETKPKADPKPKVNNNALFGGGSGNSKGSGKGTGSGTGVQGKPDGKGDLGGTGNGAQGNGSGKIGSRRNISKCEDYKSGSASWKERGKAVINICVNAKGKVISAEFVRRKSTITSQSLIDLVVGCAEQYKYEKAPGMPNACGEITIQLGLH